MKNLRLILLSSMLLIAAMSGYLYAAPEVTVNTEYYLVYGETEEQVRAYLANNVLIGEDGNEATALTESSMRWKIDMLMEDSLCRVTSVEVGVDITFFLPKRADSEYYVPELEKKWEAFMRAIEGHEDGHKDITVRSAEKLERRLWSIQPEESCDIVKAKANDIGNRINEEARELNKEYDIVTNHGASEGIVF